MTSSPLRAGALAPAAIGLALLIATVESRMNDSWGDGVLLLVALLGAALLIFEATSTTVEDQGDRAARTVLLVTGLGLAGLAIARLGQVLTDDDFGGSGGSLVWMLALFTGVTAWCHTRTRAAVCVLLGALAGVGLLLAAVHWVFQTDDIDVYRGLLTFSFLILFGAGFAGEGRSSTLLVVAAGVSVLAMSYITGILFLVSFDGGESGGVGWGWELVMLVEGAALAVYAMQQLEAGPGYLAFFVLGFFSITAAQGDHTLIGWPLALAIGTAVAAAWGLREASAASAG
jgi:hypothetical protein